MAKQDYYAVLGVTREATDEDIKKAYRKLVFQYHPDRNPGSTDAEEKIREINAAYEVIGDPETRKSYERLRFGEVFEREAPDLDAVLREMEEKLADEGRRELFAVLIKQVARIKAELAAIRTMTVEAQGYDSFKEDIVLARGREVIKDFVTPEIEGRKRRLIAVAVQMMVTQGVVGKHDETGQARLRERLERQYDRGQLQGFAQALEMFYVRR